MSVRNTKFLEDVGAVLVIEVAAFVANEPRAGLEHTFVPHFDPVKLISQIVFMVPSSVADDTDEFKV